MNNYKYPEVTNDDNIAKQWKMACCLHGILNHNEIFSGDDFHVKPAISFTINKLPNIVSTIHETLGKDTETETLKKVLINVYEYMSNSDDRHNITKEDIQVITEAYEEDYIQIFKDVDELDEDGNESKYKIRKRNRLRNRLDNGFEYTNGDANSLGFIIDDLSFFIYERECILKNDPGVKYVHRLNEYRMFCKCAGIDLMNDEYIESNYNEYEFATEWLSNAIDSLQDLFDDNDDIYNNYEKELICKCIIIFSNTLITMTVESTDVTDGRMTEEGPQYDFTKVMPYYEFITFSNDRNLLSLPFGGDELIRHDVQALYPITGDLYVLSAYLIALTDYYFLMSTDGSEYTMKQFISDKIFDEEFMSIFGMTLINNNMDPAMFATLVGSMYEDTFKKYSEEGKEYLKFIGELDSEDDEDEEDIETTQYSDTVSQVKNIIDSLVNAIDDNKDTNDRIADIKDLFTSLETVLERQYMYDLSKNVTDNEFYTVDGCVRNVVDIICVIEDYDIYPHNRHGELAMKMYNGLIDAYGINDTSKKYTTCFIKHLMEYCISVTISAGDVEVTDISEYNTRLTDVDIKTVIDTINVTSITPSHRLFLVASVLQYSILSMYADHCAGVPPIGIVDSLNYTLTNDLEYDMSEFIDSVNNYIKVCGINLDKLPGLKLLLERVTKLVDIVNDNRDPEDDTDNDTNTTEDSDDEIDELIDSIMDSFMTIRKSVIVDAPKINAMGVINTNLGKLVDIYDDMYDGHIELTSIYTRIALDRIYDVYVVDCPAWSHEDILYVCGELFSLMYNMNESKVNFNKYSHILPFTYELMEYAIAKSVFEYAENHDCVYDIFGSGDDIDVVMMEDFHIMGLLNHIKDNNNDDALFIVMGILKFFRLIILMNEDSLTKSEIIKKINDKFSSRGNDVSLEDVLDVCRSISKTVKNTSYMPSAIFTLTSILNDYYSEEICENAIADNVSEDDEDDTVYTESDLLKLLVHKDPEKWTLDDIKEITRIVVHLAGSDTNDDIRDFLLKFSRRNPYLNAANTHSRITAPAHKKIFEYIKESNIIDKKFTDEEYALSEYKEFSTALKGILYLSDASTVKFLRDTVTIIDLRNKYDIDNLLSVDSINVLDIIKDYTELCTSGNVGESMSFDIKTELNRFMAGILNIIIYLANDISLAKEFSVNDTAYFLKLVDRVFGCTLTQALEVIEDCSERCGLTEEYHRLPELIDKVRNGMDLNPALFNVELTSHKVYVPMLDKEVDVMIDYADTVDKFIDLIIDFVDDSNIEESVMMSRTMSFIDECKIFSEASDLLFISDAEDARGLLMIAYAFLDSIMDDAIEAVMDNDFVDTLTDLKRSMKLIHNNIIAITE